LVIVSGKPESTATEWCGADFVLWCDANLIGTTGKNGLPVTG
jgi:hypothetical protein